MRTNEAPGAVSEQIRCITSCCGCEQHQTNEQQKPILPHPPPDEPKVCSVGQVEEALMQFGPALILDHHSQSARSRLELCVLFTSCGPSSVMQRLREPCGLFCLQGIQTESRASPGVVSRPEQPTSPIKRAPLPPNQLIRSDLWGLHGSTGCNCSGLSARRTSCATCVASLLLRPQHHNWFAVHRHGEYARNRQGALLNH